MVSQRRRWTDRHTTFVLLASLSLCAMRPALADTQPPQPGAAPGSILVLARTEIVSGAPPPLVVPIVAPTAGTFTAQLTDLGWPDRLASLSFAATTATTVLASLAAPGQVSFFVASSGTYYAQIAAKAQGALNIGLYSLRVDFTPVPLPASLLLLLSGLGGLAAVRRRVRR